MIPISGHFSAFLQRMIIPLKSGEQTKTAIRFEGFARVSPKDAFVRFLRKNVGNYFSMCAPVVTTFGQSREIKKDLSSSR